MQGPYTKTVGLIVPSSDVNIEATYHRFAPPGIAVAIKPYRPEQAVCKNAGGRCSRKRNRQRKTCATPNRTS